MGIAALLLAMGLAVPGSSAPARTVPCNESIAGTRFPYVGDRRPGYGYRLVLGVVSVPPAYQKQVVPTGERPWTYFRKAGLIVRASGQAVTIGVPRAWRGRAGIAWGYGGHGVFSSLRIAGCHVRPTVGFAYSGGFYLRARSACVPLIFRVGRRSATIRFGLGRPCG
jgi:hypothetical protein